MSDYYNPPPYGYPPLTEEQMLRNAEIQRKRMITERDRKLIKRAALVCGIGMLSVAVISEVWSIVYLAVMAFFGISPEKANSFITSEPMYMQLLQIGLSTVMFIVPFTIVAKAFGYRISDIAPYKKSKKGTVLPAFLFGFGFCAFADVAESIISSYFEGVGINYDPPEMAEPTGIFGFAVIFIATAVAPALLEEFACRGIIMGVLEPFGKAFAVFTSAIVFGLMHGNFQQIPFAFMVGVALGYIRIKTGSLTVCMIVHFFNNSLSVILDLLAKNVSVTACNMTYAAFLLIGLAVAAFGLFRLSDRGIKEESGEKQEQPYKESKKYRWFFTQPTVIIFTVISLIEALAIAVI